MGKDGLVFELDREVQCFVGFDGHNSIVKVGWSHLDFGISRKTNRLFRKTDKIGLEVLVPIDILKHNQAIPTSWYVRKRDCLCCRLDWLELADQLLAWLREVGLDKYPSREIATSFEVNIRDRDHNFALTK